MWSGSIDNLALYTISASIKNSISVLKIQDEIVLGFNLNCVLLRRIKLTFLQLYSYRENTK